MNLDYSLASHDEVDVIIIKYLLDELTYDEIAEITGYSSGLIKRRLNYIYKIYGVKSKVGLVKEIYKKSISLALREPIENLFANV